MTGNEDDVEDGTCDKTPWLRDMVGDALLGLFSEDEAKLKRAVRHLIRASRDDPDVEEQLIELLEVAVDEGNDDSSASLMTAVILGEIQSLRAIGILTRCLAWDADEMLEDAAEVALLRVGAPAISKVMETIDEDDNPSFNRPAYGLLGQVGLLGDEALRQKVMDFLETRVETERRKSGADNAIDDLFRASAHLGDRRQLGAMKNVLAVDFRGRHAGIQDSCEMLEENVEGVPFVATQPPWEARYGWLFEDERDGARVTRSGSGRVSLSFFRGDGEEPGVECDDEVFGEPEAHTYPEEESREEEKGEDESPDR